MNRSLFSLGAMCVCESAERVKVANVSYGAHLHVCSLCSQCPGQAHGTRTKYVKHTFIQKFFFLCLSPSLLLPLLLVARFAARKCHSLSVENESGLNTFSPTSS